MKKNNFASKVILSPDDYEKYSFTIPAKIAFSRDNKKFVSNQLEKMHPNFSNHSCFDSKMIIKQRKIYMNVAVMDKLRLLEYRRSFPGKKFYIPKEVSLGKLKIKSKIQVFKTYSQKVSSLAVMILSFFVLICTLICFASLRKMDSKPSEKFASNSTFMNESSLSDNATLEFSNSDIGKKIFVSLNSILEKNSAVITSFDYENTSDFFRVSANVENVLPEKLISGFSVFPQAIVSVKNVSYINNSPQLLFECMVKIKKEKASHILDTAYATENFQIIENIRKSITSCKANLVTETFSPYRLNVLLSNTSIEDFCRAMAEKLNTLHLGISAFSFAPSQGSENQGLLKLCFENGENHFVEIANICSFIKKEKTVEKKVLTVQQSTKTASKIEQTQIVGEIIRKDGRKVIFYKNPTGKILQKEEF